MVYVNEKFIIMMTYCIMLKRYWKVLFKGNNFDSFRWNYYHQKPETNPETWYVNEKNFVLVECYISVERRWKRLFNSKNFENGNWHYYDQKPQTWCMSMKNYDALYTVEKHLKIAIQW